MTSPGADENLTLNALRTAMTGPADIDGVPSAVPDPAPRAPGRSAAALTQLSENADLFGFAISARRPVVGLRPVKRLLRRLQHQVFARQTDFNQAAASLLDGLVATTGRHEVQLRSVLGAFSDVEQRLQGAERRLDAVLERTAQLAQSVEHERVRVSTQSAPEHDDLDYVGLQARFRGDIEEIAERQRRYVPYFAAEGTVLDIGCGRGEFLGLLRDGGRSAIGVDADQSMVALCREQGFDVSCDDGLHHLLERVDDDLDGVFAAQVVEHLRPAQVAGLVQTALRKLRPGGALILETVNPTSLVALMNFYLDFTHVAPIHPLALKWLVESAGFVEVEVLYLSPAEDGPRLRPFPGAASDEAARQAFDEAVAATNEILYGPRDFAIVARKP